MRVEDSSFMLDKQGSELAEQDTGKHYRFVYRVRLSEQDRLRGFVEVKLDPFRISSIYKTNDFARDTILKKCLCAGARDHNSEIEDMEDIITAARRRIEMLREDIANSSIC